MESRSFKSASIFLLAIAVIGLATPSWSSSYEVLYTFGSFPDAQNPEAGLVFDSVGNLYGTTFNGGTHNVGAVYELSPVQGGWSEQVIYSFTGGADGARPVSTLAVDPNGHLYGTASMGGSGGGVVFELSPSGGSWTLTVIHTFAGGKDGLFPLGGVILDGFGNLIGTASNAGMKNNGIVFQLSPPRPGSNTWSESLIHTFQGGTDDSIPVGKLTMDRIGRIYGTTRGGVGSVYRLNRSDGKWVYHSLWCFCNGGGGETLYGGVAVDGSFHIYGTTYGSANGNGEVFELIVGRPSVVIPLYQFTGKADGANPQGGVVLDALSRLWGTTAFGGDHGVGVLFSLTRINHKWIETPSHSFGGIANSDGANPITDLIFDASGNLYATISSGGSTNGGVLFEFTP